MPDGPVSPIQCVGEQAGEERKRTLEWRVAARPRVPWTFAVADRICVAGLLHDALGEVARDGEADAHAAARGREDRGVDADHLALGVEGRAAGIALVQGGVDLQEVVVGARVRPTGRPCAESSRLDDFDPDEQTFCWPVEARRGNPCVDRGLKLARSSASRPLR
jgi:hypothetical protein